MSSHLELEPQPISELTPEVFWEMWGDKSELEVEPFEALWEESARYYRNLDYHNFEHALETLWETMHLADIAERNGIHVNRKVLIAGALLHDALVDQYLSKESPYTSKEQRSVALIRTILPSYDYSTGEIDLTASIVSSTEAGVKCQNLEARTLRRADIKNLRENPISFISNSLKLYKEHKQLLIEAQSQGYELDTKPKSWREFVLKQQEILYMLLDEDLSLGDFDKDESGQCVFNVFARYNADLLSTDMVTNAKHLYSNWGKQLLRYVPWFSVDDQNNPTPKDLA